MYSRGVKLAFTMDEFKYDDVMDFLLANNLCCIVNPAGKLYGKSICIDCYRKIRRYITDLVIQWEISALEVIKWQKDN